MAAKSEKRSAKVWKQMSIVHSLVVVVDEAAAPAAAAVAVRSLCVVMVSSCF